MGFAAVLVKRPELASKMVYDARILHCRGNKMPLLSLLSSDPTAVSKLTIEQIVATAGDGKLKDGTESQEELRGYLQQMPVESLGTYIDYCLSNPFQKSGQVLQDIVNELGRRLEYEVTNGRYQGVTTAIGYDGIWREPSGHWLVIEVKTTDAYRLSLDTLAGYRDKLLQQGKIQAPCSILIVVGRTDTGELEAQVRGSRHAWDMRLISVESLINLVRVKESADNPETVGMIRRLLTPLEYTRLDKLVDVVFTTTKDVETTTHQEPGIADDTTEVGDGSGFTPTDVIQQIRNRIVAALKTEFASNLVKKSRALYWDPQHQDRVVCTISKRYTRQAMKYWYAYHPKWHEFLSEGEKGYFVLGCTDLNEAFALPVNLLAEHLEELNKTTKPDGSFYYHIHVHCDPSKPDRYALNLPHNGTLDLEPYKINLTGYA